jgi:hypothetical protein
LALRAREDVFAFSFGAMTFTGSESGICAAVNLLHLDFSIALSKASILFAGPPLPRLARTGRLESSAALPETCLPPARSLAASVSSLHGR